MSRFLPACAGVILLLGAAAIAQDSELRFDVVSVKPNPAGGPIQFRPAPPDGINYGNYPLRTIVEFAFDLQEFRILNLPSWIEDRFDIVAKAARTITQDERRAMVRTLLRDRFGLRSHLEPREQTVFVMTSSRRDRRPGPGLKLRTDCPPAGCSSGGTLLPDRLTFFGGTLDTIARMLTLVRNQIVVNETGFAGVYDVDMSYRPEVDSGGPIADDGRPSFVTALDEQLGVTLTPGRRMVDVLVIDRLERPTPD
jgi:uncharacterized protein (TIGR03435 family)